MSGMPVKGQDVKDIRADLRVDKTRSALLVAFRELVLAEHYEDISVADIADRAGVSRSTLYEHFAGKDGILAASIAGPFSILVDTLKSGYDVSRLIGLLEHFWGNRRLARAIFLGPIRRKTVPVLVRLIEKQMIAAGLSRRGALILPMRLAAVQLAEILLAPVIAWLLGESRCTATVLATSLHRIATAALAAMRTAPRPARQNS
jgi:AcrR family transcriptional regulator